MEKWKKKALELLTGLAFTERKYPAVIPYTAQKTFCPRCEGRYFHRTSPERQGVSNALVYEMLCALENEEKANLHSILVLKDDEVITECSREGYDVNIPHQAYSMSKTLTGIAIGFLVDEGKLSVDTLLTDIFPEYAVKDKRFKAMTVEHLLTMQSGVSFSEAGAVTETEWTRAFFNSKLDFAPGTRFAYNSMNSYILSRIVRRISGLQLTEFLTEHLFGPLGIRNGFWEVSPEGIEKGGWGAYLSVESFAKIGLMMMSGGSFEGEEILSREWVNRTLTAYGKPNKDTGGFNYGYHLWVSRDNDEFLFNGMLGQNVWMCPRNGIVVSMTAENNEMFQNSSALRIIQKYLGGNLTSSPLEDSEITYRTLKQKEKDFYKDRRWATPKEKPSTLSYRLGLRHRLPFDDKWSFLLGTYTMASNNQGILPLFVRIVQNNYSGGIESISFERVGDELWFTSHEGGTDYKFEVGLYEAKISLLDFNGEKYLISALGEATKGNRGEPLFKIELVFPELANTRKIEFTFGSEGQLFLHLTESPDGKISDSIIEALYVTSPKLSFALKLFESKLGDKIISRKLRSMFSPTISGVNKGASRYYEIMNTENEKADKSLRAAKPVSSIIFRVMREEEGKE